WREGLLGLADRLDQPVPIAACAAARVQILLRDRTGPLYDADCEYPLGEAVWRIADAINGTCPPHAWGCPVIMKVDPGRVAWTCSRCGTVALSHDLAWRPE